MWKVDFKIKFFLILLEALLQVWFKSPSPKLHVCQKSLV